MKISNPYPRTVGGNTMGRIMADSNKFFPANSFLDMSRATIRPKARSIQTAINATFRERIMGAAIDMVFNSIGFDLHLSRRKYPPHFKSFESLS